MTDADLDRIERQWHATTLGPWAIDRRGDITAADYAIVMMAWRFSAKRQANATFVVAAHAAVPLLIAEVRQLREVFASDLLAESPALRLAHRAGQEAFRERVVLVAEDWLKGGHGGEATWIGNAIRELKAVEP